MSHDRSDGGVEGGSGAALEAAARARHASGDHRGALELHEAAFRRYRTEGDRSSAARAARTVGWFRGWVFGVWTV